MLHIKDRSEVFTLAGNFWSSRMAPGEKYNVRNLSILPQMHDGWSSLNATLGMLIGREWFLIEHSNLDFNPDDVVTLGPDLQKRILTEWEDDDGALVRVFRRPASYLSEESGNAPVELAPGSSGYYLSSGSCSYVLYPSDSAGDIDLSGDDLANKYLVPIPDNVRPVVILAGRDLVAGIDFKVGKGYLIFEEDPHLIFKDNMLCRATWVRYPQLSNYSMHLDGFHGSSEHIMDYYRNKQTPASMEKALASAAGRVVTSVDIFVEGVVDLCSEVVYLYADGELTVNYHHTRYVPGDFIPAGTIIGGGVKVRGGNSDNPTWYREFDWTAGISLDTLCPVKGITIPDNPVLVEAYDSTGPDLHLKFYLNGPAASLVKFWGIIKSSEIVSGLFLNDVVGLAVEGDTTSLNPLDFYFQNIWRSQAIVVEFDIGLIDANARKKCLKLLEHERPIQSIIITKNVNNSL